MWKAALLLLLPLSVIASPSPIIWGPNKALSLVPEICFPDGNCISGSGIPGDGTVTSVGLTAPSFLSVTGSPVTASGTLQLGLVNQSANTFFAGPSSGGDAAPTFRLMVASDVPSLPFSKITGTVPILQGGTGQTTANGALNALLPAQTGNSGKILSTNGTDTSWVSPGAGSGTVTEVKSTNGSIGVTDATTTPNLALAFPIQSTGLGSNGAPTIRPGTDNDSGLYSTGDGNVSISANSQQRLNINQNSSQFIGPLDVTGDITASNYPPNGAASTFAGYDSSGDLFSINGLNFNTAFGMAWYNSRDFDGSFNMHNMEAAWEIPASTSGNAYTLNIDSHWDRNNTGEDLTSGGFHGLNLSHRLEGSGLVPYFGGLNINMTQGENGATSNDVEGLSVFINSHNGASTDNARSINVDYESTAGGVTNNLTMLNMSSRGQVDGQLSFLNFYKDNSGDTLGDFRFGQWGNDSVIGGNGGGLFIQQNGTISKSYSAFYAGVNADAGDGTGTNLIAFDSNFGGGTSYDINGSIFGFNFNNSSKIIEPNSRMYGVNISNGSGATMPSITGFGIYNQADLSEEFRGLNISNDADVRTATAIDISFNGNATDDVQGIRLNLENQTSTNQRPAAIVTSGGNVNFQSQLNPKDNLNVDIGNGFFLTSTVQSGSPIVGTDMFQQLIQSNLLLQDTMTPGPFGLGMNAVGIVSQLAIDSGVTLPSYRSAILGTSAPVQSTGGEVTELINLELVGLVSFGGTIVNPTRYAIKMGSPFLGQSLCDGATDCWGIWNGDAAAENYFKGNLVLGGTTGHGVANAKLIINEGHTEFIQGTPPAAAPDSNAGTSATCTVTGSDTTGTIELTTGSGSWAAGLQCAITFNRTYANAPTCTFSPNNQEAALAGLNVYKPNATTAGFEIWFVNPDTAASTYRWDYRCN